MARRSRAEILRTHDWRRYNAKTPETQCRCERCSADWSRHCREYNRTHPESRKRQAEAARIQRRDQSQRNQGARREAEAAAAEMGRRLQRAAEGAPLDWELLSPANRRAAILRIEVVFPF